MSQAPAPVVSERAANVLRRVLDVAARVLRALSKLAVAAGVSVSAAWLVSLADGRPAGVDEWIPRVVVLAALLVPPAVLFLFVAGVNQLRELPGRARTLPADVRMRAAQLRDRSRRTPETRGPIGAVVALFSLARLVLGSREVLSPYAAVTAALRPAILVAALVATVAAVIEVPASILVILLLLA